MEHLHDYNLTPAQFDVIAHLSVAPGISQQELAERLLVTKGNICGLIGRLEERGLVTRCQDPEDRRSNVLNLTDRARQLAAEVIPAHEQFILEHMSSLTQDEQRTLLVLLRDLDRSLVRHQH
jgi:DNA-binding MarR family transcriptional regulator